jgi:hypothetical protein
MGGRKTFGLVLCFLVLGSSSRTFGAGDDEAEYQLKLAFLYNFAKFVLWPPDAFHGPEAPLTICVAGEDPFKGALKAVLRGRTVGGHALELRTLKQAGDPRSCQIVFVRSSEKRAAPGILAQVKGGVTLTVGEAKGFTEQGGMINLTMRDNKIGFEVNIEAASQSHLQISSKLLALARIVRSAPGP